MTPFTLNDWTLIALCTAESFQRGRGWRVVHLGLAKWHTEPFEGTTWLNPSLYRGWVVTFYVWIPLDW